MNVRINGGPEGVSSLLLPSRDVLESAAAAGDPQARIELGLEALANGNLKDARTQLEAAAPRSRVVVANATGGGVLLWVGRLYLFLALIVLASAVVATLGAYRYFAVSTPPAPDLSSYTRVAPAVTRVYAADGTKLGEFAELFPFSAVERT